MKTEYPTVELFFVFAFTYCKLTVYEKDESLARKILEANRYVELVTSEANTSWQEIDTRLLLAIVSDALPKIISNVLPRPKEVAAKVAAALGRKQ